MGKNKPMIILVLCTILILVFCCSCKKKESSKEKKKSEPKVEVFIGGEDGVYKKQNLEGWRKLQLSEKESIMINPDSPTGETVISSPFSSDRKNISSTIRIGEKQLDLISITPKQLQEIVEYTRGIKYNELYDSVIRSIISSYDLNNINENKAIYNILSRRVSGYKLSDFIADFLGVPSCSKKDFINLRRNLSANINLKSSMIIISLCDEISYIPSDDIIPYKKIYRHENFAVYQVFGNKTIATMCFVKLALYLGVKNENLKVIETPEYIVPSIILDGKEIVFDMNNSDYYLIERLKERYKNLYLRYVDIQETEKYIFINLAYHLAMLKDNNIASELLRLAEVIEKSESIYIDRYGVMRVNNKALPYSNGEGWHIIKGPNGWGVRSFNHETGLVNIVSPNEKGELLHKKYTIDEIGLK